MHELDLENPIFVVYIDVEDSSVGAKAEKIDHYRQYLSFSNATTWLIPTYFDKIEMIWQGSKYSTNPGNVKCEAYINLINEINDIVQILSEETNDSKLKEQIRNLQLKKIIE